MADEAAGATVEAGSPASMLVDFIPIREYKSDPNADYSAADATGLASKVKYYPTWLPGAGWKRKALAVRELGKQMVDYPYDMVKNKMVRLRKTLETGLLSYRRNRCGADC